MWQILQLGSSKPGLLGSHWHGLFTQGVTQVEEGATVGADAGDLVGASVGDSVGTPFGALVGDSVGA